MASWLTAVLLGFIEGLTEFIPVSSTGHLLIAEQWIPRQSDLFNIVIQTGAVLAVLPLFRERLAMLARWRERASREMIAKIAVAFFITCAGGYVLEKKGFELPESAVPVALALVAGGVLFIVAELWLKGREVKSEITWPTVFLVAGAQLVAAAFPGASRSGATIVFAMLVGVGRPLATEFSFLVGIPTMVAAGGLKIIKALHHPAAGAVREDWGMLLLATAVSAIVSIIAVKWLLRFVQTHSFVGFGIYRIVLGVLILVGLPFIHR